MGEPDPILKLQEKIHLLEQQLAETHQLMQSDNLATTGLMFSGLFHEINNPLAAVKLAFSLLSSLTADLKKHLQENRVVLDGETSKLFESIEEFIFQGQRSTDNMTKIMSDIRVFSRSDRGETKARDINSLLDGVIAVVWNGVKNKTKIVKEYSEVPNIHCNTQELGQVFLNLLVNASQAMDSRGLITIRTSVEGKNVRVDVIDTGCGISKEVMDHIFEPFFTTKGAEDGTGVGLSITRDIVKKHNGDIRVESVVGQGTTFSIFLPI